MKKIKNIFRFVGLAAFAGATLTSCDLDLLPLNEVVLENYWTNKDDVDKVLNSCYVGMQQNNWVTQAIIWGEVRSDNIAAREGSGSSYVTPVYLQNIIKGNLKQNNQACNWSAYYRVINYCNTVIHYAPEVAAKDPNITPSILAETLAQARAIRALNYFYLLRTFKDIPFTTEPSIDDTQNYMIAPTKGEVVLDAMIADLEACKNDARRRYASYEMNTARITRNAIYALLADMYLWKASDANLDAGSQKQAYQNCVDYCKLIIDYKVDEYRNDSEGRGLQTAVDPDIYRTYGYALLREDAPSSVGVKSAQAYAQIFGSGNSFETIFELTYGKLDNDIKNTDVGNMYNGSDANNNRVVSLGASTNLLQSKPTSAQFTNSATNLFPTYNDYRSVTGFLYDQSATSFYEICKYVFQTREGFSVESGDWSPGSTTVSPGTNGCRSYTMSYEPWIIYRLSDVMLMSAEAQIQMAKLVYPEWTSDLASTIDSSDPNYSQYVEADGYVQNAFKLTAAVFQRSNPAMRSNSTAGPALTGSTTNVIKDLVGMETLIESERHRELLFEGKRYYDLVRRARREGNTQHINEVIQTKFNEAPRAFIIKMAQMDYMYMPYAESELKANPNLHQNPVYAEEDKTSKN